MPAVLAWVMHNTVQATLAGITEAASQGMQFAATHGGPPELCVWPERLSVEELYGSSKVMEAVPDLLAGVAEHYTAHLQAQLGSGGHGPGDPAAAASTEALAAKDAAAAVQTISLSPSGSDVDTMSIDERSSSSASSMCTSPAGADRALLSRSMEAIDAAAAGGGDWATVATNILDVQERFSALGSGHAVLAGHGADEECERELEQEEEEEQEAEVQVPAAVAAHETDWVWSKAFTASGPDQLGMRLWPCLRCCSC